jgi:hypothetical protein
MRARANRWSETLSWFWFCPPVLDLDPDLTLSVNELVACLKSDVSVRDPSVASVESIKSRRDDVLDALTLTNQAHYSCN